MPAKTTIFDTQAKPKHNFSLGPRNTILFSPNGRFVLVAGFGNLAGQCDMYDLEKDYAKITTIEASNASFCEWSPDGKHILTATTSPRLRVDNGVRVWHVGGSLMYNEDMQELYDVQWRPRSSEKESFEDPFHPLPTPHASAMEYLGKVKTPSKPAGAYRPPGARGTSTPLHFKREDEGGAAFIRDAMSSTPSGDRGVNGMGGRSRKQVPGASSADPDASLPPGAAPGGGVSLNVDKNDEGLSKAAMKNKKKREAKKAKEADQKKTDGETFGAGGQGNSLEVRTPNEKRERSHSRRDPSRTRSRPRTPAGDGRGQSRGPRQRQPSPSPSKPRKQLGTKGEANKALSNTPAQQTPQSQSAKRQQSSGRQPPPPNINGQIAAANATPSIPPAIQESLASPTTPGSGSPHEKKVRALLKKLRAIDDLKMRQAGGEPLELSQVSKIESEDKVRKELDAVGGGSA